MITNRYFTPYVTSLPRERMMSTMRYPSDESTGGMPPIHCPPRPLPGNPGGWGMETQRYPSDDPTGGMPPIDFPPMPLPWNPGGGA